MRPKPPFLDGPPSFAVGLSPIPAAAWLAPDWEAAALPEKRRRLAAPDAPVAALHGFAPAQAAAAALIAEHLGALPPADLAGAAALVSDDLVLLARDGDGAWRAVAAVLCAPTFFTAEEAIGRTLAELHGPVPAPGLAQRIARVFEGLRPDLVLERRNWTVQAGAARFTPRAPPPEAGPLHLRVERQTLRRLAAQDATLFTIRVSLDPLEAVLRDPVARMAFAAAWAGAPAPLRTYKRWDALAPAVEALLG